MGVTALVLPTLVGWGGGRRTLQVLAEVAQGGCRMQPGCPPLSADMPLGSQPIQGACGAQMPAVSVAATPPPCTHREPRGLQTECSQCSQDSRLPLCCLSCSCLSYRNGSEEGLAMRPRRRRRWEAMTQQLPLRTGA